MEGERHVYVNGAHRHPSFFRVYVPGDRPNWWPNDLDYRSDAVNTLSSRDNGAIIAECMLHATSHVSLGTSS